MIRTWWLGALMLSLVSGCATSTNLPSAARSELAPTGKIRAAMNLGNALFTTKSVGTGELRGVSVDVMRELASRLGVAVEFVVDATPGDVADAAAAGTRDVPSRVRSSNTVCRVSCPSGKPCSLPSS